MAALLCAGAGHAQDAAGIPGNLPKPPTAILDETLAIGGEEIEARKFASRLTVETYVNGEGPFRFVVDSGADTSVVGERLAGRLSLPSGDAVLLHGVTESRVVDSVIVESLRLGPTTTTDLELPVLDERDLGGDGMIGLDALVEQRLMMDFDERIITVDDAFTPAPFNDRMIVVKGRLDRGQLILAEVEVDRLDVEAVVDTGSEITIGNTALRDRLKLRRADRLRKIKVYGVTGAMMEVDFAVVKKLKLGPIQLYNVPIAFADIPPFEVLGMQDEPSLLLGTDLMENFRRVSLDFKDRKARFQLKKCANSAVKIRTSEYASRLGADRSSACS
ncbi:aspartyl protease family protein [Qipengyuania sp. 6D47A]|uniref:Aspartyl protease family protein n=1 Tax=Qipengyuania qiaonensis TaxID=2867240 RepID=A0ABS7J8I2_9SPHN|nr:aspartyl protease family protein [Qipengyuania qiaonensis]